MSQKIDQIFEDKPKFETERLRLIPITEDDFELFHALFTNKEVAKYSRLSHLVSKEDNLKNFNRLNIAKEKGYVFTWKVILKETGAEIARVNIGQINRFGNILDMGYVMFPDYWRKGIMTEAVSKLISYLFNEIKLHKITANTNNENLASKSLLSKLGFLQEGLLIEHSYYPETDDYTDNAIFGLLRSRYKALKNN